MEYIHPEIKFPNSNKNIELDIFVPDHHLALEYQGEVHYHNANNELATKQLRDSQKLDLCKKAGITLIQGIFFLQFTCKFLIGGMD